MRFGFFFFAEYVNVFIISALTVTLFLGAWNAPFPWPWPVELSLNPGALGIGILILFAIVPLILTLAFAAPIWMIGGDRVPAWLALLGGFILANLARRCRRRRDRLPRARLGRRPPVVPRQDLRARLHLRLDARDAARASGSTNSMDFAWKWLAAGVAAQPLRHGRRHRRLRDRCRLMGMVPGLGIAKGMALTLRRFFEPKVTVMYPEDRRDPPHKFRAASAALRRVGHAQVRDLLPVRSGLPASSASTWAGWTPAAGSTSTGARPRRTANAARGIGPPPLRPDGPRSRLRAVPVGGHRGRGRDPRGVRPRPGWTCSAILEATQAAYGYLPVAALKRISQRTGAWYAMIYGTASYYGHLRFEPRRGDRPGRCGRRSTSARGDLSRCVRRCAGGERQGRAKGTGSARAPGRPGDPGAPARA